jgi:transcriptional regulator with XRE-family HTH domain
MERDQLERGEQPTVSSAAFRAGAVIRIMRKSRGLTQAELAECLGVSQARVSEMEAGLGPRGPSWDLMERVANACSAIILVSPLESDRAIDASSPGGGRQWTVTAAGG